MKKILELLCCCFMSVISFGQTKKAQIAIIPEPVTVTENAGYFSLPQNILIEADAQPEMKQVIAFLKDRLSVLTGIPVIVKNSVPSATIKLILNKKADNVIGKEGYHLLVTSKNIVITSNEPAGLYYGVQTLIQLFPKEIESGIRVNSALPAGRNYQ